MNAAEIIGGKENCQEKTLTMQDEDPKGVGIPHDLHECALTPLIDHKNDSRTPVTISNQSDTAQDLDDDHCEAE